jgi:hypothetical protein
VKFTANAAAVPPITMDWTSVGFLVDSLMVVWIRMNAKVQDTIGIFMWWYILHFFCSSSCFLPTSVSFHHVCRLTPLTWVFLVLKSVGAIKRPSDQKEALLLFF